MHFISKLCQGKGCRSTLTEILAKPPGNTAIRCLFGVLLTSLNRGDELGRSPKQGDFSFSEDCPVVTVILSLPTASFQLRPSSPSDDSVQVLQGESSLLARSFV